MPEDLYGTLGIERDASPEDVRKAYRRKAKEVHPDVGGKREDFDRVSRAMIVLTDPDLRAHYDRTGEVEEKIIDQEISEALEGIARILTKLFSVEEKPEHIDIVTALKANLGRVIKDLNENMEECRKFKARVERVIDRATVAEGENYLQSQMQAIITNCERELAIYEKRKKATHKAIELLTPAIFAWTPEPPPLRPFYPPSSYPNIGLSGFFTNKI